MQPVRIQVKDTRREAGPIYFRKAQKNECGAFKVVDKPFDL